MANVTVTLITPIEGHEGQIKQIVLRAPKYADVMLLGEPAAYARSTEGMIYQAEKDDVVKSYIERLCIEPKDTALLNQLELADALKLKEAVFDFFLAARLALST
jgi:hypothetical protein